MSLNDEKLYSMCKGIKIHRSLTDEQIDTIGNSVCIAMPTPLDPVPDDVSIAMRQFGRAIESATAAPLLERIKELERALKYRADIAYDVGVAIGAKANEQRIAELEQQLEAARKDAGRAEVLLKALVTQIDRCNPVDDHGHNMKMNAAYLAAKELL